MVGTAPRCLFDGFGDINEYVLERLPYMAISRRLIADCMIDVEELLLPLAQRATRFGVMTTFSIAAYVPGSWHPEEEKIMEQHLQLLYDVK